MGEHGDNLEANLGALFKPIQSDWDKFKTTIELAAALGDEVPGLGIAVKAAAWSRAWFGDAKKSERVQPVILGLYERLKDLEGRVAEFVRRDEAQAVFEDAFARIGDQPEELRREGMRRILHKTLQEPRDPADIKLFLRWADELPAPALKLLNAAHATVDMYDLKATNVLLAQHAGVDDIESHDWIRFLVNQCLFDAEQIGARQYMTFEHVLTPLGRAFAEYRRGT